MQAILMFLYAGCDVKCSPESSDQYLSLTCLRATLQMNGLPIPKIKVQPEKNGENEGRPEPVFLSPESGARSMAWQLPSRCPRPTT